MLLLYLVINVGWLVQARINTIVGTRHSVFSAYALIQPCTKQCPVFKWLKHLLFGRESVEFQAFKNKNIYNIKIKSKLLLLFNMITISTYLKNNSVYSKY